MPESISGSDSVGAEDVFTITARDVTEQTNAFGAAEQVSDSLGEAFYATGQVPDPMPVSFRPADCRDVTSGGPLG